MVSRSIFLFFSLTVSGSRHSFRLKSVYISCYWHFMIIIICCIASSCLSPVLGLSPTPSPLAPPSPHHTSYDCLCSSNQSPHQPARPGMQGFKASAKTLDTQNWFIKSTSCLEEHCLDFRVDSFQLRLLSQLSSIIFQCLQLLIEPNGSGPYLQLLCGAAEQRQTLPQPRTS